MNTITQEMRNEWYKRMDEPTLDLYQSNGLWLREVFATTGLPEEKYRDFVLPVGDVLMGLAPQKDLIPVLMLGLGIDHPTAEKVNLSVTKYLFENIEIAKAMKQLAAMSPTQQIPQTAQERLRSISPIPEAIPRYQEEVSPIEGGVPDADSAVRDELLLKPRMTEKIVSRAVPEPGAKPLTREDILRSLAAKRTLASDVSALQQNGE